jgi:hypothetical protein
MTVVLPNIAEIRFGRDYADKLTALLGFDIRTLAVQHRGQYRSIGCDPTAYYMLPDGRVALERSRQMRGLSEIVIFADRSEWQDWRAADARELTFWGTAEPSHA